MKHWLRALALLLMLSISWGCSGLLIHQALNRDQTLTPAQIEAYNKVGSQVFSCFQVGGPPPIGNWVLIVVPKGSTLSPKFGANCQLLQ